VIIDDPNAKPPAQILAFDSAKKREPEAVDLDAPFFTVKVRPEYPACDHRNRGVTLDVATRRAICLCGEQIDAFDALLIYAHAQRRLISHAETIKEYERKEAEKKARRPFAREVTGWQRVDGGFDVTMACGHHQHLYLPKRRHPWRRVTCEQCAREHRLKERGVSIASPKSVEASHV
jgi:hypothetical protein